MKYIYLALAIILEVLGSSSLKASEGFTKLTPSIITVLSFLTCFFFLSQALKEIPLGIAYAIWAGLGIVLTALGSVFGSTVLWVGAGLMSLAVLFSIVTLPVEFNASSRAMKQITALNIVNEKEYKHAKKVLSAAAMTYVASTAVALAEVARIILIARSSD